LFRKTPLKAQNDYIFYKFGGRHGPFGHPLATPMLWPSLRKFSAYATAFVGVRGAIAPTAPVCVVCRTIIK